MSSSLLFSTIEVTRQAFYRSSLSYAIVNLKPLVPGHVLVIPTRAVPRLTDLSQPELTSLMGSIQRVGRVVERAYGAKALTVACQDGEAAGQSVPHVHFHILPRGSKDDSFSGRNDDVYPALERAEGSLPQEYKARQGADAPTEESFKVDADENRHPRSMEDMEKEAIWLKSFFDTQPGPIE